MSHPEGGLWAPGAWQEVAASREALTPGSFRGRRANVFWVLCRFCLPYLSVHREHSFWAPHYFPWVKTCFSLVGGQSVACGDQLVLTEEVEVLPRLRTNALLSSCFVFRECFHLGFLFSSQKGQCISLGGTSIKIQVFCKIHRGLENY